MKPVGKRSAGNPHAAFDERGKETERTRVTAPFLDSTDRVYGDETLAICRTLAVARAAFAAAIAEKPAGRHDANQAAFDVPLCTR
jgi:hypothetical protein